MSELTKRDHACLLCALEMSENIATPLLIPSPLVKFLIVYTMGEDAEAVLVRWTHMKFVRRATKVDAWELRDEDIPARADRLPGELPEEMPPGWSERLGDHWAAGCREFSSRHLYEDVEIDIQESEGRDENLRGAICYQLLSDHYAVERVYGGPLPGKLSSDVILRRTPHALEMRTRHKRAGSMEALPLPGSRRERAWHVTDEGKALARIHAIRSLTSLEIEAIIGAYRQHHVKGPSTDNDLVVELRRAAMSSKLPPRTTIISLLHRAADVLEKK